VGVASLLFSDVFLFSPESSTEEQFAGCQGKSFHKDQSFPPGYLLSPEALLFPILFFPPILHIPCLFFFAPLGAPVPLFFFWHEVFVCSAAGPFFLTYFFSFSSLLTPFYVVVLSSPPKNASLLNDFWGLWFCSPALCFPLFFVFASPAWQAFFDWFPFLHFRLKRYLPRTGTATLCFENYTQWEPATLCPFLSFLSFGPPLVLYSFVPGIVPPICTALTFFPF